MVPPSVPPSESDSPELRSRRKRVLLLAATDMEQTIEAARAIERESDRVAAGEEPNAELVHALETALAVCYWRPFTNSSIGRLDPVEDGPPEASGLVELHRDLETMRKTRYAHTDKVSGRDADVREHVTETGVTGIVRTESQWEFPEEWLPRVIALAEMQRERFITEALKL